MKLPGAVAFSASECAGSHDVGAGTVSRYHGFSRTGDGEQRAVTDSSTPREAIAQGTWDKTSLRALGGMAGPMILEYSTLHVLSRARNAAAAQ